MDLHFSDFTSPGRKCAAGEGRSRPAGERAALAAGGVSWRRESGSGPCVRARRVQGAGQVALDGSLRSTWPRTRHGRSPPAAYGRAVAKQIGEMEVGTYLQFLNSQGPLGKLKFSLFCGAQMKKC